MAKFEVSPEAAPLMVTVLLDANTPISFPLKLERPIEAVLLVRLIPLACLLKVFLNAGVGSIRPIAAEGQLVSEIPVIPIDPPAFSGLVQSKTLAAMVAFTAIFAALTPIRFRFMKFPTSVTFAFALKISMAMEASSM
ncbi:MAG: hypothetical protein J0M29_04380 [Chitinophagales bacterium]|nr:hypothetical protein [Chitinophagales bacterium]